MTDIKESAPTLRELLTEYDSEPVGEGWIISQDEVEDIETDLLAPLRNEIATLRTQVAAADALRSAAKKLVAISTMNTAMEKDMETWFAYQDVFRNAVKDYDATKTGGTAAPNAVIQAASEFIGMPVAGALWLIGRSVDGLCFVAEKWGDGGGWTSWKQSFTECLEDIHHRIETDEDTPPATAAPVGKDTKLLVIVPEMHWGTMKSQLMEWMGTYMMSSGMTNIRRPGHRANVAYFLACKLTGEKVEHDDFADDDRDTAAPVEKDRMSESAVRWTVANDLLCDLRHAASTYASDRKYDQGFGPLDLGYSDPQANFLEGWVDEFIDANNPGDEDEMVYGDPPTSNTAAPVNNAQHEVAEKISEYIKATRSSGVYPTSENAREFLAMVDTFYELKSSSDTPPAVADAGETGEDDVWNERVDRDLRKMKAHLAAVPGQLAALRRDVDALESEQRLGWQLHMEKRFAALESPRVPVVPVVVTDAMAIAAQNEYWSSTRTGDTEPLEPRTIERMRRVLVAALSVAGGDTV